MQSQQEKSASSWFEEGEDLYYKKNRPQGALECFTEALTLRPDYFEAYAERANVLRRLGKYEEALQDLNKSMSIQKNSLACFIQTRTLIALGRMRDAEKSFKLGEIISQTHESYSTVFHKGNALDDLGRKEEAINAFDEATKLNPDDFDVYLCKGKALSGLDRDEEAIRAFDEAIKLDPNSFEAYYSKGVALIGLGRKEEAIRAYDEAIKLSPDEVLLYCAKGQALNALNRDRHTLLCYNKAYELSKTGKPAQIISEDIERYINAIVTEDRKDLLNKLERLQALTRVY